MYCIYGYIYHFSINYKSYDNRLALFKLESLELRRLKYDLFIIFKITHQFTDSPIIDLLDLSGKSPIRSNGLKVLLIFATY